MPRFRTKPVEVDAVELTGTVTFNRRRGRAGDFLVTHPDGRQELVSGADFARGYEPAGNGHASVDTATLVRQSRPARKAKNGKARKQIGVTPEVKARARIAYEAGETKADIAKAAGVSGSAVYLWAKAGKWQRPAAEKKRGSR